MQKRPCLYESTKMIEPPEMPMKQVVKDKTKFQMMGQSTPYICLDMFSFLEKRVQVFNKLITKFFSNSTLIWSPNAYLRSSLCPIMYKAVHAER